MDEFTNPTAAEGVAAVDSGAPIGDGGTPNEPTNAIAESSQAEGVAPTASESTAPQIPQGYIPEENLRKLQASLDRQLADERKQKEQFRLQAEQAEAQRQEIERLNADYQQRLWQQHLANLPIEQQEAETYKYQVWQYQQEAQRQLAERDRQYQSQLAERDRILAERDARDAQLEPIFKNMMIEQLSKEKGIPRQYLEHAAAKSNDPNTIALVAEALALAKQAGQTQTRKEERVDSSEGTGRGSGVFDRSAYLDSGNLAEFIRARREATGQ